MALSSYTHERLVPLQRDPFVPKVHVAPGLNIGLACVDYAILVRRDVHTLVVTAGRHCGADLGCAVHQQRQ